MTHFRNPFFLLLVIGISVQLIKALPSPRSNSFVEKNRLSRDFRPAALRPSAAKSHVSIPPNKLEMARGESPKSLTAIGNGLVNRQPPLGLETLDPVMNDILQIRGKLNRPSIATILNENAATKLSRSVEQASFRQAIQQICDQQASTPCPPCDPITAPQILAVAESIQRITDDLKLIALDLEQSGHAELSSKYRQIASDLSQLLH